MIPIRFAQRMQEIEPFRVMEVLERAGQLEKTGRRIVHMEIGQPDFAAPQRVIDAAIKAMRERTLGYTPALGIMELREAIAGYYLQRHGLNIPASRIAVTTGSSAALLLALSALVGPGDEVLLPDPCYPCSRHLVRLAEARPIAIPTDETTAYQPTADMVAAAWRPSTRGILLASPSNPAGTIVEPGELQAICELGGHRGGFTIVDEIYSGLLYEGKAASALCRNPDAIVVSGFSKYFCMTGWRLGWLVAPEPLIREVEKLAQNAYVSPPVAAQYAALAAFHPESLAVLETRRLEFHERRNFLFDALRFLGFGIPVLPQGAFYLYADCARFAAQSNALAHEMLEQAGVAGAPGKGFGEHQAHRYLRFAYTRSRGEIEEGVERLAGMPVVRSALDRSGNTS